MTPQSPSRSAGAETLARAARATAAAGRLEEAQRLFKEAVSAAPREARLLLELGVTEAQLGRNADAQRHLERALKLRPDDADIHFNLGQLARLTETYEKAVRHFRRALELDPTYADAAYGIGETYFAQRRYEDAEPWLKKAVAANPRDKEALNALGITLVELRRPADAITIFQAILDLDPGHAPAKLGIALAYDAGGAADQGLAYVNEVEATDAIPLSLYARLSALFYAVKDFDRARRYAVEAVKAKVNALRAEHVLAKLKIDEGDFDAGEAMLRKALREAGPQANPWYMLSQINRLEPEAEKPLRKLAADEKRSLEERSTALFALYALVKRHGDDAETFRVLDQANALARARRPADISGELRLVENSIATFAPAFFEARRGEGDPREGPVFVMGMPRSGTTLTEQILAAHPAVLAGDERGDILDLRATIPGYPQGIADLPGGWAKAAGEKIRAAMFKGESGQRFATDKLPGNYMNLGLIAWILPQAKFVYCKRDPHDNALSLYEQNFGANLPYATDLEACGHMYREHLRIMRHWQEVGLAIHTVDYDALVADPEPHIRALVAFLGLDWHEECLTPQEVKRGVATASVWQVRQPISKGSVGKWKRFQRQLEPFTRALNGSA
jgi:tetratricopeptide (TPR) repeat protein